MDVGRLHRLCAVLALLLAAGAGCSIQDDIEGEEEDRSGDAEQGLAAAFSPLASACWGLSLVGHAQPCAPQLPPHWTLHGTRLFADGTQSMAARGLGAAELPDALAGFCLYQWTGEPGTTPIAPEHGALDCPAVEPQLLEGSAALHQGFRSVFEAQVGSVDPETPPGPHPVRVGVVDAGSSDPASVARIAHAESMVRIIELLACPGPDACGVDTRKALALPLVSDGTLADPGGGDYGTRAHVAVGIMEAVTAWRQELANAEAPSRLVLNLSLGWVGASQTTCGLGGACGCTEQDPWCGGLTHVADFMAYVGAAGSWSAPPYPTQLAVEAVHGALLYASCQGAVIVAAAGNAKDASCNGAPVAPASWADLRAPTEVECEALGFFPPAGLPPNWVLHEPNAPLLVPVAAVDHHDRPLALTRPGSYTRLVAPGFHVSAERDANAPHMDPVSGTSAAAAAVSAGVASLWSHDPTLGPRSVVDALYLHGDPVGGVAQLSTYGSPAVAPTRRLSICGALHGVLGIEACVDPPPLDGALHELHEIAGVVTETSPGLEASLGAQSTEPCSTCGQVVTVRSASDGGDDGIEHYLLSGCAMPTTDGPQLAGPQPDLPVCPECPVITEPGVGVADLALHPAYQSTTIVGGWLRIEYDAAVADTVLDLEPVLAQLRQGTVRVSLGTLVHPLGGVTIGLRLQDDDGGFYLRSNPLLLLDGS
ncbi:MAG: S8 family serine peptidase [Deltaproteobacteria bacterium]|nr:S8 family serine peptidase [Deltaproteobacteria bacterium]